MKIFIFGAGASRGAQDNLLGELGLKCPTTEDFFSQEYKKYAKDVDFTEEQLTEFTRDRNNENLEKWLTEKWDKEIEHGSGLQNRNTLLFGEFTFYIWSIIWNLSKGYDKNTNLYTKLLRKLRKNELDKNEEFKIITFNYDTFIDKAYIDVFNEPLHYFDDYKRLGLFKPHGSINWLLNKRDGDLEVEHLTDGDIVSRIKRASQQFYAGETFKFEDIIWVSAIHPHLNDISVLINERCGRRYFYPLIFIPLTEKFDKLVTDFNSKMITSCVDNIKRASDIYLIGYKARDKIIDELLNGAEPGANLKVINRSKSSLISDEIKAKHPQLNFETPVDMNFEQFVSTYE